MKIEKFGNLSNEQIKYLEKRLNIILPEEYKAFLRKVGGGVVEKDEVNQFLIEEIGEVIIIDVLFGENQINQKASITFWMDKFCGELLENSIIIGDDLLQGFLVMICGGDNAGIYYWDDAYNFEISDDENNMYLIAKSFEELLKKLETNSDAYLAGKK